MWPPRVTPQSETLDNSVIRYNAQRTFHPRGNYIEPRIFYGGYDYAVPNQIPVRGIVCGDVTAGDLIYQFLGVESTLIAQSTRVSMRVVDKAYVFKEGPMWIFIPSPKVKWLCDTCAVL